jgi:hypothetical protein
MSRRNQWNAVADHVRDHVDDEFVHLRGIEEACDKFRPTDQPDVFPLFCSQTLGKDGHVLVDD